MQSLGQKRQSNLLPMVSVGVPVYNEAKFLRSSLEALVTQDYENIEIIISDNGSTDETPDICREFADKYPFVSFHRFKENSGAANNFNHVFNCSSGKYFMWAAGHDRWSSNYIGKCVDELEGHSSAAIAFGSCCWIDEVSEPYNKYSGFSDTKGLVLLARYMTVIWGNMHPILGLIRSSFLAKDPMLPVVGADLIMLTDLVIKGDFLHASGAVWNRREFREELTYEQKLKRYQSKEYFLTKKKIDKVFPLMLLPFRLISVVWHARLRFTEKLMVSGLLILTFPFKYISARRAK